MTMAAEMSGKVDAATRGLDTFELIRTTRTLGMFQIESPGQRELVGKLGPTAFDDLIVDTSPVACPTN